MMADGIANFCWVVTDAIVTGLNHLDVLMADVSATVVTCWPFFEMADGIATVADGIATFVMADVIVIVADGSATYY